MSSRGIPDFAEIGAYNMFKNIVHPIFDYFCLFGHLLLACPKPGHCCRQRSRCRAVFERGQLSVRIVFFQTIRPWGGLGILS